MDILNTASLVFRSSDRNITPHFEAALKQTIYFQEKFPNKISLRLLKIHNTDEQSSSPVHDKKELIVDQLKTFISQMNLCSLNNLE